MVDLYEDFSEFYDLYVGDWLEDYHIYFDHTKTIQTPVLEVGAGSGRLTIPLAQSGISVVAVDISSSMLAILESRLAEQPAKVRQRIQVVEADAGELSMGTQYDLILVPFYTFNYFLTPQAQIAALDRFRAHLAQHGRLLIDAFIPVSRIADCPSDPVLRTDTIDPRSGDRAQGWNTYRIDQEHQIEHRTHLFVRTQRDGQTVKKRFTTQRRYFFPPEMEDLFLNRGLSVENVFTGYKGGKPNAWSEQLLYVLKHNS